MPRKLDFFILNIFIHYFIWRTVHSDWSHKTTTRDLIIWFVMNTWNGDGPMSLVWGVGKGGVLMCLMRNEDVDYLHVFPERAGVCVGLVAHFTDVWLVWRVHVHVLFPVAAVGETSVTAIKFTLKRLLTCGINTHNVNDPIALTNKQSPIVAPPATATGRTCEVSAACYITVTYILRATWIQPRYYSTVPCQALFIHEASCYYWPAQLRSKHWINRAFGGSHPKSRNTNTTDVWNSVCCGDKETAVRPVDHSSNFQIWPNSSFSHHKLLSNASEQHKTPPKF